MGAIGADGAVAVFGAIGAVGGVAVAAVGWVATSGVGTAGMSKKVICFIRRGSGGGCKREHVFVKDDMARDDDSARGEIHAAVTTVVGRVAKEDASRRTGRKFMFRTCVAVVSASTQKLGGRCAWNSRERTTSLVVRIIRSALPFCCDV